MPRAVKELPIITKVGWNSLFQAGFNVNDSLPGTVFANFGHHLDGFTLSLGSGLVLSELILGKEPSVDLSPFQMPV
jgi:glycine/D-amino acid oxidase-like deaminating enzyme